VYEENIRGATIEIVATLLQITPFAIHAYGSLFEGKPGSGVFSKELDLKASFSPETFATVFHAEVYTILAVSTVLGSWSLWYNWE
jgi:hypothetical protein